MSVRGERLVRLAEFILWGSLAVALYAYGLYAFVVWVLSRSSRDANTKGPPIECQSWPSVTLLIRAALDEHSIVKCLENALALDYPHERLQILVACSGEEDLTALLARSFDRRLVDVLLLPKRSDASVLNNCLRQARGEIVVLSNARTLMHQDALRRLAEHFYDAPEVGGVCGKLKVVRIAGRDALDGRFSRLENFVTRSEARLERFPDLEHGFFAVRTNLFPPLSERQPVDLVNIALDIVRQGFRLIYDERAVATREALPQGNESLSGQAAMAGGRGGRLPAYDRRRGFIAGVFWMHRVLRRVGPAFLIAAFVSNACLLDDPFYLHVMLFHELFYVAALVGLYCATSSGRLGLGRWRLGQFFPAQSANKNRSRQALGWLPDGSQAVAGSEAPIGSTGTAV